MSKQAAAVPAVNAAPEVDDGPTGGGSSGGDLFLSSDTRELAFSVPYKDLSRPLLGPQNPYKKVGSALIASDEKNMVTGHVETHVISDLDFETQRRSYASFGYAIDPTTIGSGQAAVVGDMASVAKYGVPDSLGFMPKRTAKTEATANDAPKRRRQEKGKPADLDGWRGPWAGYEGEGEIEGHGDLEEPLTAEQIRVQQEEDEREQREKRQKRKESGLVGNERTVFHGRELHDYQGRTYMSVPRDQDINLDADTGDHECYLPKRVVHHWKGHTMGVNAIRFFPRSGHLLLSASNDSTIKIWDVYNERRVLRTYAGHDQAVRDICFNHDGSKFLSASFDKYVKLWDTETGKCIRAFTNNRIVYCARYNPDPKRQNVFLAGSDDHKILQYDIASGQIVQEYNEHLKAVNTITFVDDNRRFVSTSDDKSMRVWEYDIPVSIKLIADPAMHGLPSVSLHPNKKFLGAQSLDNKIVTYACREKFTPNHKKTFEGHMSAGYACQVNFSPDGQYVVSGDAHGNACFWSWKTCKLLKKIKACDQVTIGAEWHPQEPSKVAVASWDNSIKLLD